MKNYDDIIMFTTKSKSEPSHVTMSLIDVEGYFRQLREIRARGRTSLSIMKSIAEEIKRGNTI